MMKYKHNMKEFKKKIGFYIHKNLRESKNPIAIEIYNGISNMDLYLWCHIINMSFAEAEIDSRIYQKTQRPKKSKSISHSMRKKG